MFAITVSVNYSDELGCIVQQNVRFFKKWFIVTMKSDTKTIKLLEDFNDDRIHILLYDGFHINNCTFNKGGAIKHAQDYIDIHFKDSNILILDSDIFLPDDFEESLPPVLESNTLYGVSERIDYWSIYDFITNTDGHEYKAATEFVGFFQLYKQNSMYKYQNSYNCGHCDNLFRELFHKKITLKILVKHIGKCAVHWNGKAC